MTDTEKVADVVAAMRDIAANGWVMPNPTQTKIWADRITAAHQREREAWDERYTSAMRGWATANNQAEAAEAELARRRAGLTGLAFLWRQREHGEPSEHDLGYELASDECADALERALTPALGDKP